MPLGIQRLNAKKSQPNDRIVFIKPLKGPDEAIAQDFLERIAAQCLPIMREHHLSVMSLEEYEPNGEFVGRNFNAGEVIQLVLKARFTGHWLPFHYVQMVMMHELAHCKQMNHSKAFWSVRNQYAEQMRQLFSRGYAGEGLWGRGALLGSGEWEKNTVRPDEALPEHLCGGTYRSRGRKRKAKKTLSYQEQKERRIRKRFGAGGVAVGEDKETKKKLEKGRSITAKPRVAGSARGRELRAAAALARFETKKEERREEEREGMKVKGEHDSASGSETESGQDYDEDDDRPDARNLDGSRILDDSGRRMVKVCEDENPEDQDAQNELRELHSSMQKQPSSTSPGSRDIYRKPKPVPGRVKLETDDSGELGLQHRKTEEAQRNVTKPVARNPTLEPSPSPNTSACPICSFANDRLSPTCGMCANVLDASSVVDAWRCKSQACAGSTYLNAGDCGVCGVCSTRRTTPG